MDFAKLTKFALFYNKICIYNKKAIPLQRQLKKNTKVYTNVNLTYSRLDFIHKSKSEAKLQKIIYINKLNY